MNSAVTFIMLLGCVCWVSPYPCGQSVSFFVVFSNGTRLMVNIQEEAADNVDKHDEEPFYRHDKTRGFDASVQILSSIPLTLDPESPRLLVCVLSGLNSSLPDVLWWVNDVPLTSVDTKELWRSEWGGAYSIASVLEVSAADWRLRSTYWCGMVQQGKIYRQKLCSDMDE